MYSEEYARQKNLVKYILEKIDRHLNENAPTDYSQYSIEHIEPQSSQKISGEMIASLGNLMFIPEKLNNENLKNRTFAEKKKLLLEADVMLDPILMESTAWTEKRIAKRFSYIADLSYSTIWKM